MKLAEALAERKALTTRINGLVERLGRSVAVQEGDSPVEAPDALRAQIEEALGALELLVVRVHRTNASARVSLGGEDVTLTEALARRDRLGRMCQILTTAAGAATPRERFGRQEIRYAPTIDVARWRADIDALTAERVRVDNAVQAAGWQVDLLV